MDKNLALLMFIFCSLELYAAPAGDPPLIDKMFITGVNVSVSSRTALYELSNGKEQKQDLTSVVMFGVELGKRFPIVLPRLRLFVPIGLNFGAVKESVPEVIALQDGTSAELELKRSYLAFGFTPQIQYRIPVVERKSYFYVSVGGGVCYSMFNEEERIAGHSNVRIIDSYLESGSTFSGSFDCGAGLDLMLSKRNGLSLVYAFKLWNPVKNKFSRDLFPVHPITYKELCLTHKVGIQFLLR